MTECWEIYGRKSILTKLCHGSKGILFHESSQKNVHLLAALGIFFWDKSSTKPAQHADIAGHSILDRSTKRSTQYLWLVFNKILMRVGEHLGWCLWGEAGVCFLSFPEGVTGLYFVYCRGRFLPPRRYLKAKYSVFQKQVLSTRLFKSYRFYKYYILRTRRKEKETAKSASSYVKF